MNNSDNRILNRGIKIYLFWKTFNRTGNREIP